MCEGDYEYWKVISRDTKDVCWITSPDKLTVLNMKMEDDINHAYGRLWFDHYAPTRRLMTNAPDNILRLRINTLMNTSRDPIILLSRVRKRPWKYFSIFINASAAFEEYRRRVDEDEEIEDQLFMLELCLSQYKERVLRNVPR